MSQNDSLWWSLVRSLMFKLDPERAHDVTMSALSFLSEASPDLVQRLSGMIHVPPARLTPEVFGMKFLTGLGLGAGFDKNAQIVSALPHLGFGFCEIGTVTPVAQPGHVGTRLMRDFARQSLFNRMGFNNLGAKVVSENLSQHKKKLPSNFRVGVNIGKNKDTQGTYISKDYAISASYFLDLADFFVINVSSPNTEGLRALQSVESLSPILDAVFEQVSRSRHKIPVLVKLAPELDDETLGTLIEFFESQNVSGLVLTNTLAGETLIGKGGWSGAMVKDHAMRVLVSARAQTKLPIISVGGIDSVDVAKERLLKGANLVELYSSWVFKGPTLPPRISSAL